MSTETILTAREILGDLTPLSFDCGLRCGAACCQTDADGQGGVYLLPGEEAFLTAPSWGRVDQADLGPMLCCDGPCDRDARPFLCRVFPLTPFRKKDGALSVRVDARARGVCPLTRGGVQALRPDFVEAVRTACALLMQDDAISAFLEEWMREEREVRAQQKALRALLTT